MLLQVIGELSIITKYAFVDVLSFDIQAGPNPHKQPTLNCVPLFEEK